MFVALLSNRRRDFHEELRTIVEVQDPLFRAQHTKMWSENLPTAQQPGGVMSSADTKLQELEDSQQKMLYQADTLSLARDASVLASLYREEMQSERADRLARVMHLKQENQIGTSLVMRFMQSRVKHLYAPKNDLMAELDKAWIVRT